jgi:hypothetical protein
MSKSRNRAISWIVLVVFSLVIFCSSAFIITHTNHDCTGEDCSVCMELAKCHKTLNALGTAVTGGLHLSVMMFALAVAIKHFTKTRSDHTTLISLKVELLN